MSNSQHPVALRVERRVGGATRLLATVMALPLVDGVFAALVLAGALDTAGGVLQVGLLVFGGSATVAVILAEMDGTPRETVPVVAAIGVALIVVAGIEAALAPTMATLVDLAVFERFAALVILAIAASTASARIGELLPRPAVIVGLGLIASLDPAGVELVLTVDQSIVVRGAAAAGVAALFCVGVTAIAPTLRRLVDLDRFRFGSAVALGTLPLAILGYLPGNAPLAVFAVAGVLAFDPGSSAAGGGEGTGAAADGGRAGRPDEDAIGGPDHGAGQGSAGEERAPWM